MGGCKSMDLQSYVGDFEPSANDIYDGTIAFCSLPYNRVTHYVGNSASQSAEERKAYKDKVWSNWEKQRKELIAHFESKQFTISQPAGFFTYDEATGLMKLDEQRTFKWKTTAERSAIPNKIAFNTYDNWFSPSLPTGWVSRQAGDTRHQLDARRTRAALNKFGKSVSGWGQDVYVINDFDDAGRPHYEKRIASYNGQALGSNSAYPNQLMSVLIDTKRWYENLESPVLLKDGSFYLDTNKVNVYDTFGVYPDIGKPHISITYTFKFTGCSQGQLTAEVNEISISPSIYKANL